MNEKQIERPAGKIRDSIRTRRAILKAATKEFSESGLSGARVDKIALQAKINKRMLYHYFGDKEGLYQAVIERVYEGISQAADSVRINDVPPIEGIKRLIEFVSGYYTSHPEAINLLHEENVYRAAHLTNSTEISKMVPDFVSNISRLVERGKESGEFSSAVTMVNLYVTILALVFYYRSHQYTLSIFLNRNLTGKQAHAQWRKHIEELILDYVRPR